MIRIEEIWDIMLIIDRITVCFFVTPNVFPFKYNTFRAFRCFDAFFNVESTTMLLLRKKAIQRCFKITSYPIWNIWRLCPVKIRLYNTFVCDITPVWKCAWGINTTSRAIFPSFSNNKRISWKAKSASRSGTDLFMISNGYR